MKENKNESIVSKINDSSEPHFDHYCSEFKEVFIVLLEKYGIKNLWISKCGGDNKGKDPLRTKREYYSSYYMKWDTVNFRIPSDGLIIATMLKDIILEGDEDRVSGLLTAMSEEHGLTFETYELDINDYVQLYKDGV